MSKQLSRRNFLRNAAAAGITAAIYRNAYGANEKLNHASVGIGGMMGGGDLGSFMSHPKLHVAAMCDVDKNHLNNAAKNAKDARQYRDWREMLDKEGDKIDSVNVTVPDHMHAIITLSALNLKKHVYCQKPLCHDVAECRAVAEAAKKAGTVTQLGTQVAATSGDHLGVKFLKDGIIGKAKRAILCSNRSGAVEAYRLAGPRPAKTDAVPASMDWNLWLGTAPERPFVNGIYHPSKWRCWLDFGTGWSGDIGCHIFDAVWKGLGLTAPKTVIAEVQKSWQDSPARRADNWPQSNHVTWIFPGNDKTDGDLTLEWFDGEFYPPEDIRKMTELQKYPEESSFVLGTDGAMLLPHQGGPQLFPKEKFKGTPRPSMGGSHYHRFVDACLGGTPTLSHFQQTGPMAEAIILGTVAIRCPGQKLEWDAANLKVTNCPDADKLLRRTYRDGWKVMGA